MTDPIARSAKVAALACPNADAPLFLTGFARSGTTWINKLLRDYFDAGFVNEGQFIVSFGRRLGRYGDLGLDRNHRWLIRDLRKDPFFGILKRNYSVEIDWQRVASVSPTFAAIVLDILGQIAQQMGKSRIGSKYPVFGSYLGLVNRHFPNCRVVHVIRDGRDCALSHKQMSWGHQNTYAAAVHWRDYLRKARRDAQDMQGRYLEIRYEDLLAEPGPNMAILEKFLTGTSGPVTERFMAGSERLKPEKIAQWRHTMPAHAQAIFEGVAGDTLRDAGYPLTGT
ncbi:MAG: sulfotransferase family protein, partial [Acidobacteriaceae bacterium]